MSEHRNVVFCGGVHGVGKTRFCDRLARSLGAHHISAGSLIESQLSVSPAKTVIAPNENQAQILAKLAKLRSTDLLILDGHFCLVGESSAIYPVPVEVFLQVSLFALLLLTDDPRTISSRLYQRDKTHFRPTLIRELQAAETSHARLVSSRLDVPLMTIESADEVDEIAKWVVSVRELKRE